MATSPTKLTFLENDQQLRDLVADFENAKTDAEKQAQKTGSFTDSDGNTFQKGAKGYAQDADGSAQKAAESSLAATSSLRRSQGLLNSFQPVLGRPETKFTYPNGDLRIPFDEGEGTSLDVIGGSPLTIYEDGQGTVHTSPSDVWNGELLRLSEPERAKGSVPSFTPTYPFSVVWIGKIPNATDENAGNRNILQMSGPNGAISFRVRDGAWRGRIDDTSEATPDVIIGGSNDTVDEYCVVFFIFRQDGITVYRDLQDEDPSGGEGNDVTVPEIDTIKINNGYVNGFADIVYEDVFYIDRDLSEGEQAGVLREAKTLLNGKGIDYDFGSKAEDQSALNGPKVEVASREIESNVGLNPTGGSYYINRVMNGKSVKVCVGFDGDLDQPIVARKIGNDVWESGQVDDDIFSDANVPRDDVHHGLACEIDGDGHLHMIAVYLSDIRDHHLRSVAPIDGWDLHATERVDWGGFDSSQAYGSDAYPRFARNPANEDLFLTYRIGGSGGGEHVLAEWSASNNRMQPALSTQNSFFMLPVDDDGDEYSLYTDQPRFDDQGRIHQPCSWRWGNGPNGGGLEDSYRQSNIVLDPYNDRVETVDGVQLPGPIVYSDLNSTKGIVDDIRDPGLNDASKSVGMVNGAPVVAKTLEDGSGNDQIFVYWWDGSNWQKEQVTTQTQFGNNRDWLNTIVDDQAQIYIVGKTPSDTRKSDPIERWVSDGTDYTTYSKTEIIPHPMNTEHVCPDSLSAEAWGDVSFAASVAGQRQPALLRFYDLKV